MSEKDKLGLSASLFSLMTMVSRVFGYLRDMVCAYFFGAGAAYDAFIIAFRVPNLLRRLFAEGAFSQAFIPVLSEHYELHGHDSSRRLISKVATNLSFILILISLCGAIFSKELILVIAPGFIKNPEQYYWASILLRVTFPYILLVSLTAFVGAILNCRGKFAEAAFAPALLNIAIIFSALYFADRLSLPVMSLAIGVIIGGIVQLIFLLPRLYRLKLFPSFDMDWRDPGVRKILLLMGPAIVGASASQINSLVDSLFASTLPTGSISWLYYADRLMELPLGVFGVGFATVLLPKLSKAHARSDNDSYNLTLDWGLRSVSLIGIPAALGLFFLSGPMICSLFMYGEFSEYDVIGCSQALMAYSIAVFGIMLAKIFSSASYARQDIKTPVKISFIVVALNIVLNYLLIKTYKHTGLAMATSISSLVNSAMLGIILYRRGYYNLLSGWNWFLAKIILANSAMVVFLSTQVPGIELWIRQSRSDNIIQLVYFIFGGFFIYVSVLLLSNRGAYRTLFYRTS